MKSLLITIIVLLGLSLQAQEKFKTSDFNWSPKTQSVQKEIFYFNPETNQKEWVKKESYVFYNTYLDTMVVDLGNAKEVTECNYNIDGNLKVKYIYYLQSETQDKTLFFYNKELQLTKSQEYVQSRLFSETKHTYDKKNRLIKSISEEIETGFSETTEYSNYTSDDSYTKTSYYNQGKKESNLDVEIYKNGLLIEATYQLFGVTTKMIFKYDEKRNLISEQKDNEAPTLYIYEYDAEGNPTKITISNAQNSYLNSEIILKNTYSEFVLN